MLYLRSSKDRSDVSIDAQRRALTELAQARGAVIVGEYADAVESGKDDDRPGFQALIRDIRSSGRTWDHILVLDTARVARRRALAIIFEEHECKRRGIRIIYKSLPEADPITEMLLKSILQAMDEWHSLTSRVKGLAGMAENVRQGWRAGGRAPRGYRLQHEATGAIRDGQPVTKSRLVPGDDALQVRAYLEHRARGVKRSRALELVGVQWPVTSLLEMERNALVYAGHTVWNRSAERTEDGYVGGEKWRPRSEWIIQKGTHEALISEDEAEAILAQVEEKKRSGGKPARRTYLLAGLLVAPDGSPWNGDGGYYRLGKGTRIQADNVERAVVAQVIEDLQSEPMAAGIAAHYRNMAKAKDTRPDDAAAMKRRIAEIDKKTARLADLVSETRTPEALLRQIEALEDERTRLLESLESMENERIAARALREITAADVRRMLRRLAEDMNAADPESLRDALRSAVEKIELSPESFEAVIYLRFGPASKSGELLASPRGAEQFPAFRTDVRVRVPHNRRRAL
ncbi:MAG: recombinase family protein [Pseudomonadota bacterium]